MLSDEWKSSMVSEKILFMFEPYLFCAFILLFSVSVGLILILLGKGRVERLLVLQLLGTSTVAVVLLLAQSLKLPGLRDLALVLGLLACILALAFIRYGGLDSNSGREKR